jgi:hypothetical protein
MHLYASVNTKPNPTVDLNLCHVLIELRAESDKKFDQLAQEFRIKFEHAKLKCLTDIPHQPVKRRRRVRL